MQTSLSMWKIKLAPWKPCTNSVTVLLCTKGNVFVFLFQLSKMQKKLEVLELNIPAKHPCPDLLSHAGGLPGSMNRVAYISEAQQSPFTAWSYAHHCQT